MSQATDRQLQLRTVLQQDAEPTLEKFLWSASAIDKLLVDGDDVDLQVQCRFPARHYAESLRATWLARIRTVSWVREVNIDIAWSIAAAPTRPELSRINTIKNIVAVASGKGGVGKSTTAANLALALAYEGAAVGVLDADIYGPSQPRMLGLGSQRPTTTDGKRLQPPSAHGVKAMSIGLLIDEEQPMVWRGPMVTQALNQLLLDTDWGALDYLIVDMPPGTGDIALTLAQRVPVSGAVIVTTPQDIALLDARKGLKMFQRVDVPVLGVVENMSTHVCSKCGHEEHIFGAGGGRRMAEQYGVELLGELPLDIRIREQADSGRPTVLSEPDSALGQAYRNLAMRVAVGLAARAEQHAAFPTITTEAS